MTKNAKLTQKERLAVAVYSFHNSNTSVRKTAKLSGETPTAVQAYREQLRSLERKIDLGHANPEDIELIKALKDISMGDLEEFIKKPGYKKRLR